MSDATQAPQDETAEIIPYAQNANEKFWLAKRLKFERLHRDYLAAQAAYADPDGPEDDEVKNPLWDAQDAAELALLVQPSPASHSRSRNFLDVHGLSPAFMRSGGIEKVARDWRKTSQEGKIT